MLLENLVLFTCPNFQFLSIHNIMQRIQRKYPHIIRVHIIQSQRLTLPHVKWTPTDCLQDYIYGD